MGVGPGGGLHVVVAGGGWSSGGQTAENWDEWGLGRREAA